LFSKSKENTTTNLSINQCTVIQTINCRVGKKQKFRIWVQHDWILTIQQISDCGKKCWIPSESHSQSVTSLVETTNRLNVNDSKISKSKKFNFVPITIALQMLYQW